MSEPAPIIPINSEVELSLLRTEIACLTARNRFLEQLARALGDDNRYHASNALGHYATDNEAFDHFVFKGGKEWFDQTHPSG